MQKTFFPGVLYLVEQLMIKHGIVKEGEVVTAPEWQGFAPRIPAAWESELLQKTA